MLWREGRPAMGPPQKEPLRVLTSEEQVCLERIARAGSERVDRARRARALLAVAAGRSFPPAAGPAGFRPPGARAPPAGQVPPPRRPPLTHPPPLPRPPPPT